jgi:hypothetical protein
VQRVIIKQWDHDLGYVLNTLNGPSYCWIGAPVARMARNVTDLEIILDSGYDARVIVSEHDTQGKPVLGILAPLAGVDGDSSFSVEEAAKPISEIIGHGEAIGDAIAHYTPLERFPNIYFIDQAVTLRDAPDSPVGHGGDFVVTKATPEQLNLSAGDGGINLAVGSVAHLYLPNDYGSLTRYCELYDKAKQQTNERQAKQELGIPGMVKRALMRDGWICRSTIIWAKPNPMPESVTDRPTKAHEYLFLLTKRARYYYDADSIRESQPSMNPSHPSYRPAKMRGYSQSNSKFKDVKVKGVSGWASQEGFIAKYDERGRNRRTVWSADETMWQLRSDLSDDDRLYVLGELYRRGLLANNPNSKNDHPESSSRNPDTGEAT